jgi:hypothetical protein
LGELADHGGDYGLLACAIAHGMGAFGGAPKIESVVRLEQDGFEGGEFSLIEWL